MTKYTEGQKEEARRLLALGKPLKEVSEITGIKVNTVKTLSRNERISNQSVNGADTKEKLEDYEKDNQRVIDSKSHRITTLDDLIEACEIDLSVWKIDRHVINKWEVYGAKFGLKNLIQVKAWLTKIQPEAIAPVISPVNIKVGAMRKVQAEKRDYKKALLLFDPQIGFAQNMRSKKLTPFHDRKVMDIAFQLCREQVFDDLFYGGDWDDNAMWSDKYLRKPAYYFNTQPALCEISWTFGQFRKLQPKAKMFFVEGNHEVRIENMIMKHLLPAYGLRSADNIDGLAVMSLPSLLGLPALDIEYIGNYPGSEYWLNNELVIRHGDKARKGSGATASATAKEATYTEIFGHIHRFEWAIRTEHKNGRIQYIQAFSPGCMCRIDGEVPGFDARPNWQQGVAIVHYNEYEHYIEPILINDGQAFYRDKIYRAQDYTEQLIADTVHHDKDGNVVEWNY
jgi:hypothetical protein